ncbi:hypothetical protein OsJ_29561 [Oryza sativa Japonica Group]|uniref:Uncharacterized protein n=1 Tax=Oryza sativa subsp. japonica TaxID=39947 RepID=A3BZD1_ORYSJ|nr:hypothetical protein OsJ_29561 [Oryza sativa Japonica Group]
MEAAASSHEALVKMWVFVLVQALVYLILAQSSDVFSRAQSLQGGGATRRPARSVSAVRRMLAALSDMPAGGEPSPVVAVVDGRKKD